MFMETENGLEADAEHEAVDRDAVETIRLKYEAHIPLRIQVTSVRKENWNEIWERNVTPVVVEDHCLIRAEFHPVEKAYPYEIVITPKMSFGTGHHPTTYLMIQSQLALDHRDKRVMDAGCGTAILSIMACKRGAREVEAFDIDEWSMSNGKENVGLNHCNRVRIRKGTIADFTWDEPFDIILANINRNILLQEMALYARNLAPSGRLQLSGFYVHDVPAILAEAGRRGLSPIFQAEREQWATLGLAKAE